MEEINRSVVASASAVERLAESGEIRAAFAAMPGMTAQASRTLGEMQLLAERLGATIDPLQLQMAGTNAEVVLTLRAMREAIEETRGIFTPDSGIGYQMEGAMASLEAAADALRTLALSLERNPDMLLRGKKPEGN